MKIRGVGYRTIRVGDFFYANRLGTFDTYVSYIPESSLEVYTEFLKRK